MTREHTEESGECMYCGRFVADADLVPALGDDAGWEAIRHEHNDGCEWWLTRANRRELPVWPETLVELPGNWVASGPTICTRGERDKYAAEYAAEYEADDDESEGADLDLIQDNGDGTADYLGAYHHDGYRRNMRRYVYRLRPCSGEGGWFETVRVFDSVEARNAEVA